MNKASFKNQFEKSIEKVEVDFELKRALKLKFLSPESEKKPFWNWTKAIFTAPVVSVIAIIFVITSNKELVQEVLLPQEALAQALENTFNFEAKETFFGLSPNENLQHRKLISKYYLEDLGYSSVSEIDVWMYGSNTRYDEYAYHLNEPEKISNPWSELLNKDENISCFTQKHTEPQCLPYEKATELGHTQPIQIFNSFSPVGQEKFIGDINFTKINLTTKANFLRSAYISFTTPTPIDNGRMLYNDNLTKELKGLNFDEMLSDSAGKDNEIYLNKLKNGRYFHQIKLNLGYSALIRDRLYFQIQELGFENQDIDKNSSMVYRLNLKKNQLSPLVFDNFSAGMQKFLLEMGGNIYFPLDPLNYLIENLSLFGDPLKTEEVDYKDKRIKKFVYKLEDDFFAVDYPLVEFKKGSDYFMDLFIDTNEMKFIGYSIRENDLELQSLRIEDEILSNEKVEDLFDSEKWLQKYLSYEWGW